LTNLTNLMIGNNQITDISSIIWLLARESSVNLVNPATGLISIIWFSLSRRIVRLVNPAIELIAVIWLL